MLQIATSLLTLTSLACHVLLGCCWHHGHMTRGAAVVIATGAEPAKQCNAPHGDEEHAHGLSCATHDEPLPVAVVPPAHNSHDGCGSQGHDEDPCDAEPCSYVIPEIAKVPQAALSATTDLVLMTDRLRAASCVDVRDWVDFEACTAGYRGGARLHALMAVWLL